MVKILPSSARGADSISIIDQEAKIPYALWPENQNNSFFKAKLYFTKGWKERCQNSNNGYPWVAEFGVDFFFFPFFPAFLKYSIILM